MSSDTIAATFTTATMAEGLLVFLERTGAGHSSSALEMATGLELAFRSFHLLALAKLEPAKSQLPATNQALMAVPEAAIEVRRDALVHRADFLAPIDVLDLMSESGLPCVAPHLHRGWQDRQRSCLHARQVAASAFGFWIGGDERDTLLAGLAIANRVALVPPPVTCDRIAIRAAFHPVLRLIERLGTEGTVYQGLVRRVLGA